MPLSHRHIRHYLFPILLLSTGLNSYGQTHSKLYLRVDSIIKFTLKFNIDSALNVQSSKAAHIESVPKLIIRDVNSIPLTPLIIMDDKLIEIQQLDNIQIGVIKSIQTIKSNDPRAMSIYGSRGALGIIVLYTQYYKGHIPSL